MTKHVMVIAALAITPSFASEPFIAHEWGTITSVASAIDGRPVEWD